MTTSNEHMTIEALLRGYKEQSLNDEQFEQLMKLVGTEGTLNDIKYAWHTLGIEMPIPGQPIREGDLPADLPAETAEVIETVKFGRLSDTAITRKIAENSGQVSQDIRDIRETINTGRLSEAAINTAVGTEVSNKVPSEVVKALASDSTIVDTVNSAVAEAVAESDFMDETSADAKYVQKTEADTKYETKGAAYTKQESDAAYAPISDVTAISDDLKTRVSSASYSVNGASGQMTLGRTGGTSSTVDLGRRTKVYDTLALANAATHSEGDIVIVLAL